MNNRWLVLAVLFLARTAMGFQFQSVASLSSFVINDLNIDYTQLGLLIGFYLLPGIVIAYPSGLLGRHFGDKQGAILGMTLMIIGGVLTATSHDYQVFLLGRLIGGTGAVLLNVLLMKMATDWFVGREIGTALALLVSSWPIGIGVALIVLPQLALTFSAATAFAVTAAAAALVLVLIAAIYRAPTTAAGTPPPTRGSGLGVSMKEFGLVTMAGAVWALFNVSYIILVSFAPPLLIAHGISVKDAGMATSLASWTIIPAIALGGLLLDRMGHATALMISSLSRVGAQHPANAEYIVIRTNCLHGCSWWPSVRRNARAAGRGASSRELWSRNGHLLYLVLCRNGCVDPSGRICPRSHWRSC